MRKCAWIDARRMDEIDILQAEVLRALAHPRRVQILHRLADRPTAVAALARDLGISQPNASQHLAVLRASGLVEVDRNGREACYRLADPDVMVACRLMRGVLERRFGRLAGALLPSGLSGTPEVLPSAPTAVR